MSETIDPNDSDYQNEPDVAEEDGDEIEEEELIHAKVARILNATDLVLNRGEVHGVWVGMQFVIINRNASNIRDPETNEIIGSVPVAKTIVKVVSVQQRLSIARTFRQNTTLSALAFISATAQSRVETLRAGERTAIEELNEKDSYVKSGDDAIQVTDENEYLISPFGS